MAMTSSILFLDRFFDCFTGLPGALLDAAHQFVLLAVEELQVIIREIGPLLFQLTFGNVPVAFDFEFIHSVLSFVVDGDVFTINCLAGYAINLSFSMG